MEPINSKDLLDLLEQPGSNPPNPEMLAVWLRRVGENMGFQFNELEYALFSDLESSLNNAARLAAVVGTAEFLVAEMAAEVSFWRSFISRTSTVSSSTEILATFDQVRSSVPSSWLSPRVVGRFRLTDEFYRVLDRVQAFRCVQKEQPYTTYCCERLLLYYCLLEVKDTLSAVAIPKLCGRAHDQLVSELWQFAFVSSDFITQQKALDLNPHYEGFVEWLTRTKLPPSPENVAKWLQTTKGEQASE